MKNDPRIEFTPYFNKQRKAATLEIKQAFLETLALFIVDPSHSSLRNHPLKEKFAGYRSINVTEDWRAIFKEHQTREQKIFTFHMIGSHDELYGK